MVLLWKTLILNHYSHNQWTCISYNCRTIRDIEYKSIHTQRNFEWEKNQNVSLSKLKVGFMAVMLSSTKSRHANLHIKRIRQRLFRWYFLFFTNMDSWKYAYKANDIDFDIETNMLLCNHSINFYKYFDCSIKNIIVLT